MLKKLPLLLLLGIAQMSFSQRYYSIVFDKLPQDYQLYPRTDKNEAIVPINGRIEVANWKYLSVVVFRNKQRYLYQRSEIKYNSKGDIGAFDLTPVIKSELAEYDFQVYASQAGKDSVLMVERKNIVAGDSYLIYGQSNGRAWEEVYEYKNEYCRTFGFGSYQNGYKWGLSNSDYTGGFDGEQFIVGEWGIQLQKNILENYGIPTCVINASTSGANIKTLSDRNTTNPSDIDTHYGRLLYLAQNAGIKDNIKGLFYWQAETDAVQNPKLWKPLFDVMYNYWLKDLPSVKKIYTFQIPLYGAGDYNDDVGELRDYLRQLGKFYPKITSYAPMGAEGWNGWHFGLEGYKQIGNEISKIVGWDFYGERKKLFSPNIKKIFYSTQNKDEITLAFESGQQMIYPKDTILPNISGTSSLYSLNDFFYINKVWERIASGRADANKIILKVKEPLQQNDSTIKYLPSIYPYSGGSFILHEAPWKYLGPYLKNTDGMRAFAFHHLKIAPYKSFESLNLTNVSNTKKQVSLKWNELSDIKGYILERVLAKDSSSIELVADLPANQTTYSDTTIALSSTYIYRIKAYTDLNESVFSTLRIQTLEDPYLLNVSSQINFYNNITLSWKTTTLPIIQPEFYIIERRADLKSEFVQIAKFKWEINTFKDSTLLPNTVYYYKITSSGNAPIYKGEIAIKTPDVLVTPELQALILFYNSIKIAWTSVKNASGYILERGQKNINFKQIALLNPDIQEWTDSDLSANTQYNYRIKAIGDKTESSYKTIEITTPAILTKPELTSTVLFYNSLKINWKSISGAIFYKLERKSGTEDYKIIATLDGKIMEWIDKDLKENMAYTYRIKALGEKTESLESTLIAQTPSILATPEISANVITHESIKLNWKAINSATQYILERQAQGETVFQKIFETDNLLEYSDVKLKENNAYSYRLKALSVFSESGFSKIDLKTLAILSNQNEENSIFNVFPNPANEKMTISFAEPISGNLSFTDLSGKIVFEQKITKQKIVEMNVATFKKGFYLVLVNTNQELYSQKVIIE
ncbi:MAG: T9SS type A sorting domain-containing protein [Bacteroidota bacterium]